MQNESHEILEAFWKLTTSPSGSCWTRGSSNILFSVFKKNWSSHHHTFFAHKLRSFLDLVTGQMASAGKRERSFNSVKRVHVLNRFGHRLPVGWDRKIHLVQIRQFFFHSFHLKYRMLNSIHVNRPTPKSCHAPNNRKSAVRNCSECVATNGRRRVRLSYPICGSEP